eukprot:14422811-Heterocapsa_arctica.AAC.1
MSRSPKGTEDAAMLDADDYVATESSDHMDVDPNAFVGPVADDEVIGDEPPPLKVPDWMTLSIDT